MKIDDYWNRHKYLKPAPNIGSMVRIINTYRPPLQYEVQFAPLRKNDDYFEEEFGPHDLGPGSVSSNFDTYDKAYEFAERVRHWKPKSKNDDGLDTFQQWIIEKR